MCIHVHVYLYMYCMCNLSVHIVTVIQEWLRVVVILNLNVDVCFFPELLKGMEAANSGFCAHVLEDVFDVKAWLIPHMNPLHNHTNPHIFRFFQGSNNNCLFQYKAWHHTEWLPQSGEELKLLAVCVNCIQYFM